MGRLSKILFAILIGSSFVVGSASAAIRHRRHDRGMKHEGKRFGKGVGRAGKGVGKGTGRAGRKTGRKIKHIVT
ncbi:MAG: hypothetical protein QOE96_3176 [Blastocatellia bacterium]|nr:hypothetical protein [Blastocatellia bacterium]